MEKMDILFIVVESVDAREGGHQVDIHGCFFDIEKARSCMRSKAEEMREKYDALLEQDDDWINIIHGKTYFVFEIKKGRISL